MREIARSYWIGRGPFVVLPLAPLDNDLNALSSSIR
jgi:hypothetical protein